MTRAAALLALALAPGCTGSLRDDSGAAAAALFEREVAPLFARQCGTAACHGATDDRFVTLDPAYFAFPVDEQGNISGAERLALARARAEERLAAEGAQFADLVRKPLDESLGGSAHRGGSQYRSMGDPDLHTLMRWADMARPPAGPALSPLAQRFRDEVQPVLVKKRCMTANCHGSGASNFLILDPGFLGQFDALATMRNYKKVVLHLNFETPDARLSRLVRKTIPQAQGGIFHRGGNSFFDPGADDPDLQVLLAFISDARVAIGDADKGVATGIVFVATDPTPRGLFDLSTWQPGGDVYSLVPAAPGGTLTNLTAALHAGPADIRDPAVSHDGTRVAFALRADASDCLNLYTMNLNGTDVVQVTHDTGTIAGGLKVSNVEPLWGPDDRLYFVSTRAGKLAPGARYLVSNLWRVNADGTGLLQMTFNADSELAPAWRFLNQPGEEFAEQRVLDLTFTAVRSVGDRRLAPFMRVPPDFRADYHPHYGTQHPEYQVFTQLSSFPDHREAFILMDESTVWEGGALAIVDRNLGPVIKDGGTSAVVNYVDGFQELRAPGEEVAHRGLSAAGYYRDPVAMPDGTVIVSHSAAPIDLADPAAVPPDPALERLTLLELPNNEVRIGGRVVLVDVPGKVETDPSAIMKRQREEVQDAKRHLKNGEDSGQILNFDLAVAMTVAREDSPSNTKEFDAMAEQIRWVRYVEEIALAPADFPQWPDTTQNRVGRGGHGMRRVIAEFPATADRSVFARLPAGVPFYLQTLDEMRLASATFNQYFFILPGELLKQVTRREVWNNRCGACHGSKSGMPGDTVTTPDVLTAASRVAANYDPVTRTDLSSVAYGVDPADRLEVDFERDVQPILSASCAGAGCHAAGGQAPDLTARPGVAGFSGAYEALTAPGTDSKNGFAYADADSSTARTSYLAEVLLAVELDAPRTFDSSGCGAPGALSLGDLGMLLRWLDLGASYLGIGPKERPVLPTY